MMKNLTMLMATAAIAATGGCSMFKNSAPTSPDEFRVVTKAPLTVPPDYSLRPPRAGMAQPAEVDPALANSATAFGTEIGASASDAERALVAAAGANAVSPVIRAQIDYEEAGVIRKRADNATGGVPVEISRGSGERIKLPGT